MTRRSKIILSSIFVSSAIVFFVTIVSLLFEWRNLLADSDIQVNTGPLRRTTTTSCTTRPISLEEAKKLFDFPFPRSATNIQFGCYKEWLAYDVYLRFEAPSADCIAAVPTILDYQGFAKTNQLSDEAKALSPVTNVDPVFTSPLVIPWFNPDQIQTGLETGFAGSYQPKVWIDTERCILYYQRHD